MENMFTSEFIIYIASVITAAGVIFGAAWKVFQPLLNMAQHYDEEKEMQRYCQRITLRMAVYNPSFSLADRIEAGEKYIEGGGNGYTKAYIKGLKEQLDNDVNDRLDKE